MLSKKEIIRKQIDSMISVYPIVTWFQMTQKTTKKWNEIYVNIEKGLESNRLHADDYKYFQVKSKLLDLVLKTNIDKGNNQSVCQGRLLIYGCKTPELLNGFIKILEKGQGGFIIGGLYGNKIRAYNELEKLQRLDKTAYVSSVPVLKSLSSRLIILKNLCDFSYLNNPYYKLHYLLKHMKETDKR